MLEPSLFRILSQFIQMTPRTPWLRELKLKNTKHSLRPWNSSLQERLSSEMERSNGIIKHKGPCVTYDRVKLFVFHTTSAMKQWAPLLNLYKGRFIKGGPLIVIP